MTGGVTVLTIVLNRVNTQVKAQSAELMEVKAAAVESKQVAEVAQARAVELEEKQIHMDKMLATNTFHISELQSKSDFGTLS